MQGATKKQFQSEEIYSFSVIASHVSKKVASHIYKLGNGSHIATVESNVYDKLGSSSVWLDVISLVHIHQHVNSPEQTDETATPQKRHRRRKDYFWKTSSAPDILFSGVRGGDYPVSPKY